MIIYRLGGGFFCLRTAVNVLSEVDRAVAIAAYENIANTFNENIIKSTIDN